MSQTSFIPILISEFSIDPVSTGEDFAPTSDVPADTRATSLKAQLDDMALLMAGKTSRLATPEEALRVQELIEGILANRGVQS